MSYDLLVATRTRPRADAIGDYADVTGATLQTEGAFRPGSNILVTRTDVSDPRTIDVDGPARIEPDDLPDELAGVLSRPAWQLEIHLPGGFNPPDDDWVVDLAIHLARANDGAVFDPQVERLVWPTGLTPRVRGQSTERIRVLNLEWIVSASTLSTDAAPRLLALLAATFPAGMPVRYGTFEPLQYRIDREGTSEFVRFWDEQASIAYGGYFFWSATKPGLGGSAFFPDQRPANRPDGHGRVAKISMAMDARPLHREPALADAVVRAFLEVAQSLGAAYGAGYIQRDVIMSRGRTWYDAKTESTPMPRARWWVGLPAISTWLAWFGEPYRDLVADAIGGSPLVAVSPGGLLLRCGPEPMDADQLRSVAPALPPELLAVRGPGSMDDGHGRFTTVNGPPSDPAPMIPLLE